ncbi:MAG: ferrochelatase, partial [Gemmatimonadota bacterium]
MTSTPTSPSGAPVRRWRGVLLAHLDSSGLAEQASSLASALPEGWRVFVAWGHGGPSIEEVVKRAVGEGIEELVVVPLYPQFCQSTTGVMVEELYRVLATRGQQINVAVRPTWHDDVGYVSAQAEMLAEYASGNALLPHDAHLLFVAEGRQIGEDQQDPYPQQVRRSVELVAGRLGWPMERTSLAHTADLGASNLLGPEVGDELVRLAESGERKVLVSSLSLAEDGMQALGKNGLGYRDIFEAGGGQLHSCPSLYAYPPFIAALRNLVLRGPRPLLGRRGTVPLLASETGSPSFDGDAKSLVVVGATVPNSVGSGRGPQVKHSDPGAFGRVRKSRKELREFLDWIREQTYVQEAFVWNTCQRVEFWGWLAEPDDDTGRECVVAQIREQLYGDEPEGLEVNVLFGSDAWHHAVRTASGLNSALPGDLDVVALLLVSCRIAERAGTAGPRANRLVDDVIELSDEVRAETEWGQYSVGYCYAALTRVYAARLDLDERRHVIIGGSATSRSILATLAEQFRVPKRRMTLVYRDHHGQMRLLRAAIGSGRRLRVHGYAEQPVLQAIEDADFVYFGIDHAEPVLDPATLAGLRDYQSRPLTIVDFNSCGSLSEGEMPDGVSLWTEKDLNRAVAEYAEETFLREPFSKAIDAAETWIAEYVPESSLR